MRALLILLALLVAGCLRVGPGEDLDLVCEEKSGSPRMAYGLEDLLARTRVNGTLDGAARARILEAARPHVITPGGAPHADLDAELSPVTPSAWRFVATGVWGERPPDVYDVTIVDADGEASAPDVVEAPRTIRDAALRAARDGGENVSADARATWRAQLPSCVTLREGAREVVVNVVQARVVAVGRA